jgi:hypothetical protein
MFHFGFVPHLRQFTQLVQARLDVLMLLDHWVEERPWMIYQWTITHAPKNR